jgi:hypothetical protein
MNTMTRRAALKSLGAVMGGVAAGCTPARLALQVYDHNFETDAGLTQRTLDSFVETIVPGAGGTPELRTRAFWDPAYPFAGHRAYFASDLCRRAAALHAGSRFHTLSSADRKRVVREALRADSITKRLYEGAIYLTQVAVYAGIYDDRGVGVIGFEGANPGFPAENLTYAGPCSFLPAARTSDGNPV